MRDWNIITCIGTVGQDAELKTTSTGKSMVRISLATSDRWQDRATGEWKNRTEWHNIIAFEKAAEALAELAKKGNRLMVRGKVHYNEYTKQDGTKAKDTQILVEDFGKMEPSMRTGGETSTGPSKSLYEPDSIPF